MERFKSLSLSFPAAVIGSFAPINQQKQTWFLLFISEGKKKKKSVFNQLFVSKMAAALYLMENQALPNGKNVIPKANTKENKSHKRGG